MNKFKKLLEKAVGEHARTIEGPIDQEFRSEGLIPKEDLTQDIASNVIAEIDAFLEEKESGVLEQARGLFVTEQEVREVSGVLNPKGPSAVKIEALEIIADQYGLKALNEEDGMKERFYKSVEGWPS